MTSCPNTGIPKQFCTCAADHGERKTRTIQLWRMLEAGDVIQPGDHYASSLTGQVIRCTPDMMGKKLPHMHMPHLRPAGTMEVSS